MIDNIKKIHVNYFQRKPWKGFSFSMEFIFNDIRERLKDRIEAAIFISPYHNSGYLSKLANIIAARSHQSNDINHITGEVHFLNLFMNSKNVVLTILDCGMVRRKKGVSQKLINWLYLKLPVQKSRIVTTISEATKAEIIKYTSCESDKIIIIPVAINPIFKPHKKEFNTAKPIILHIGTGYNKNLLRLISALRSINCHLVIIGELFSEQLAALHDNNISFTNEYNLSNEQLLQKYIECDIVSFVSTFEGFGMPIVEANTVERVVVTSSVSSMPEVAGNAACLVDPFDIQSIQAGFIKVINDNSYRNLLIQNGRINKLRFDGDRIADMYFDLYSSIYQN
ncbi:glycosyltransferase [Spirosoma sp. 48-14]|uniref:glycosyltransferase n=1 Tax=Spirosoma sp. 48-14 TaxID=1895854 RepID=UPI000963F96C|nr:glycosyltransferase [Spirosoma sp. 48-14]OJW75077.1 MAG: hypothetical protein BGO59_19085 [Spirosoma sp. 48-14]